MHITEAENNLITLLRTRKPYEVVTIHFDRDGKPSEYIVDIKQKLVISDEGIREVK